MADKCNILLVIIAIVIIVAVIMYIVQGSNSKTSSTSNQTSSNSSMQQLAMLDSENPARVHYHNIRVQPNQSINQPIMETRPKTQPTSPTASLVGQRPVQPAPSPVNANTLSPSNRTDNIGKFKANDPMTINQGPFNNYGIKKQIQLHNMDHPYAERNIMSDRSDDSDIYDDNDDNDDNDGNDDSFIASSNKPKEFVHNKRRYKYQSAKDIEDQFNVQAMLPQEQEDDWFDVEPLLNTKKINNTHLINPKVHLGINQIGSVAKKNGSRDFRGDVPCPKFNISPWNNSTIDPHNNTGICAGACNPI
jgi:hypothetical protein